MQIQGEGMPPAGASHWLSPHPHPWAGKPEGTDPEARGHRAQTRQAIGVSPQVRRAGRERWRAALREGWSRTNTCRSGHLLPEPPPRVLMDNANVTAPKVTSSDAIPSSVNGTAIHAVPTLDPRSLSTLRLLVTLPLKESSYHLWALHLPSR